MEKLNYYPNYLGVQKAYKSLYDHTINRLQLGGCRPECSSFLPLTDLNEGGSVTLDFKKPPATTISTPTARRCCLRRLFAILKRLSDVEKNMSTSFGWLSAFCFAYSFGFV